MAPKSRGKGAKLSQFHAGLLDWQIYRAAQVPGPGAYDYLSMKLPNGGHFSKFSSKGYCDDDIKRGLSTPGPADYPIPVLPKASGGRFNQSRSKSELDWIALRKCNTCLHIGHASSFALLMLSWFRGPHTPGPADIPPVPLPRPPGGRFK